MSGVLKIRIKLCSFAALGPGKADLLESIARTGSITAAAKDQGMSYRRAWMLVDEMNRAFKDPVVSASFGGAKGGGAQLTPSGKSILDLFRQVEKKAEAAIESELEAIERLVAENPRPARRDGCTGRSKRGHNKQVRTET
ncbi:MAG: LysR family transcriptional regulator [Rhodospirillales bacterium]|nr:MAG: LysR family transcriptional regulator [Rhodospirillales bacterium]